MATTNLTLFDEHLQALLALGHSHVSIRQRLLLSEGEFDAALSRLAKSTQQSGPASHRNAERPSLFARRRHAAGKRRGIATFS